MEEAEDCRYGNESEKTSYLFPNHGTQSLARNFHLWSLNAHLLKGNKKRKPIDRNGGGYSASQITLQKSK